MIGRLTLGAGLLALGILALPHASSGASLPPLPALDAGDNGLVETVQWRRCRYWRQECARHWAGARGAGAAASPAAAACKPAHSSLENARHLRVFGGRVAFSTPAVLSRISMAKPLR